MDVEIVSREKANLVWLEEKRLRIDYPESADIEKKQAQWEGVMITFRPMPQVYFTPSRPTERG